MHYLMMHWLEVFGVVSAVIYLYFSINRKSWLWILGILSSGIYVVVFYRSSLYADMIQNIFYVVISIYGWIKWVYLDKSYNKDTHQAEVAQLDKRTILWLILAGVILYFIIFIPVKFLPEVLNINSASIPVLDSFMTTLAFIATWMLTKCYFEQWLLWIFIDGAYIIIYFYKGLHLTGLLFIIYTVMAIIGYYKWRKRLIEHNNKMKEDLVCQKV
ncbi:MAG TPA: nicotinamide riboside transporter PnuC [Victivallales bacterium]|nr:nicotinamide riboside transporter PnuC [Victivallales bacterium]